MAGNRPTHDSPAAPGAAMHRQVSIIVAMDARGVIGHEGALPWRLSADLRRFKRLTMGHHLLMGRKTFDSIGRVLPGRTSVVLTRQPDFHPPGVLVAHDLDEALAACPADSELFVIGGGEIYRQTLPLASRLYLTRVAAQVRGDAWFPEVDWDAWRLEHEQQFPADPQNQYPHTFQIWRLAPAEHR